MGRRGAPPFERMFDKFLIGDGCWDWTAGVDADGYGRIGVDGVSRRAFKVLWEYMNGPVPEGLELDHLCRRKICLRPGHLEPVTHKENCIRRRQYQVDITHCPQGHPYSGDNLYVYRGSRSCRACARERSAAYEQRRPKRVYPKKDPQPRTLKEACKSGHLFDEGNTYWRNGRRHCRACMKEANRRFEEKRKAARRLAREA